jgi:hypothetical protein
MHVFIYLLVVCIYWSTSVTGRDIYYLRGCRTSRRRRVRSNMLLFRGGVEGSKGVGIWDLALRFIFLLTSWKYSSSEVFSRRGWQWRCHRWQRPEDSIPSMTGWRWQFRSGYHSLSVPKHQAIRLSVKPNLNVDPAARLVAVIIQPPVS